MGRATLSHPAFCAVSRQHFGELLDGSGPRWKSRCEGEPHDRRGRNRHRQAEAGPKYELAFCDRLVITPAHLRTGLPQDALAVV